MLVRKIFLFILSSLHCSAYLVQRFSYFAASALCSQDVMPYPELMIIVLEACENKIVGAEPFGWSCSAFDLYAEEAHFESLPRKPTVTECLRSVLQWLCENAGMIMKVRPRPLIFPPFEVVHPELLTVSSNELWTFTERRSALPKLNWTKSAVNCWKINLVLCILIVKEAVKNWMYSWL
jgi:hypothetical protein